MRDFLIVLLISPMSIHAVWKMLPQGSNGGQNAEIETGGSNMQPHGWSGGMYGNPMMIGMGGMGEFLMKAASKRRVDGPKIKKNPQDLFKASFVIIPPNKYELEMFVDSVHKMSTGFHRLEFRLKKVAKMFDKYVTQI